MGAFKPSFIELMIIGIIIFEALLIFVFFITIVTRRVFRKRRFDELDKQRVLHREKLRKALYSGEVSREIEELRSSPKSIKWQAIEGILLDFMNEGEYREDVKELFKKLGYIAFYEKGLENRNIITKATAIDRLGKMLSKSSLDKLTSMLSIKNAEIVSVTVRAISRMGRIEGLKAILKRLPELLKDSLIARKTIVTSLLHFGTSGVPVIVEYGRLYRENPDITVSILDILYHFPSEISFLYAIDNLKNKDPEVRARSLKVLSQAAKSKKDFDHTLLLPLFEDGVWFVRLQAAKTAGEMKSIKYLDGLKGLLFDEKWLVRNAAVTALSKLGDPAIDILLSALTSEDGYAKESICEEIEKTNFVYRIIDNLDTDDEIVCNKSRNILISMSSLGFSTPLREYLEKGEKGIIKEKIRDILIEGAGNQ